MNHKVLLKRVEQYVLSMFEESSDTGLIYHNKEHTQSVVDAATEIAEHYKLGDKDHFIVLVAAWFHDTGYLISRSNHERESVKLAETYLKSMSVDEDSIKEITQTIMATELPQKPADLLGEIMCDADLFHLGQDTFTKKNKQLRKEVEAATGKEISKEEWRQQTILFLEQHHYFTDYCNQALNDKKAKNLARLKKHTHSEEEETALSPSSHPSEKNSTNEHAKKSKDIPERGIETMFRITSGNNQRLSDMADGKAHILITVNSIILSAIISLVLRKLDANTFLIIPTFMLLTVSVLSIIFSILATRPSIPQGVFSSEDVDDKKVNLLFFGNFYKMNIADYTLGMEKVMADKDLLYNTLIMDVHAQGVVLGRKYRQLRVAYNIFMYGLVISVIAFSIFSVFHSGPADISSIKN